MQLLGYLLLLLLGMFLFLLACCWSLYCSITSVCVVVVDFDFFCLCCCFLGVVFSAVSLFFLFCAVIGLPPTAGDKTNHYSCGAFVTVAAVVFV